MCKDFPEQNYISSHYIPQKEEKKSTKRVITRRKRIQQGPFQKEDIVV
jgi:hypothetical protein